MSFDPEQITFFAKTDARGQQVPFGIKAKDRTKHVYVIGKTGMGKSTLLENMAVQDIKNGNGLAFIDPHGATAETLLEYIPEERVKDVLYFAPFDTANPISFNVMEDVGPDKRHLVVSGLMSVFKKIWVDAWSARMEYILSNTLLALLEYPDSTLLGVNRMLSDKHYRSKVVANIQDPAVKSFWVDEFANYNERYMQEAGDAIKNKIGQFTSNPLIRNIVGQPHSSFDLREVMDGKKILIANLSKGLVGESNANLLGSMLTTRLYLAAMSRADLTAAEIKEAPNFYFYVDEFQSFANATFADILSEARKYKLNLTIAHQYIEQMEEEVRNAVFGNVGTIIAFRVGPFDAEILETVFTPKFLAADIVNLGFAQIYLSLMIDGIGSQPFSAVTLPPIAPGHVSFKDIAITESRRQFAGERNVVETSINDWHAESHAPVRVKPEESIGNSERSGSKTERPVARSIEKAPRERATGTSADRPREARPVTGMAPHATRVPASHEETTTTTQKPVAERPPRQQSGDSERSTYQKPNPERQVADLRGVLKKIAGDEKESLKKEVHAQSVPQNGETKSADDSRDALKAALAAAIGVSVAEYQSQQQPVLPATETVANTIESVETNATTVDQAVFRTHTEENTHMKESLPVDREMAKKSDNPLSPKRLERMMRVTGNDRNPLR